MGCDLYIGVHYIVMVTRWQSVDGTSAESVCCRWRQRQATGEWATQPAVDKTEVTKYKELK